MNESRASSLSHVDPSKSAEQKALLFQEIPPDVWENVGLFLSTPDVLRFLSSNSGWYRTLNKSFHFWKLLSQHHYHQGCKTDECGDGGSVKCAMDDTTMAKCNSGKYENEEMTLASKMKQNYLIKAHSQHLASVRWLGLQGDSGPTSREGHLCCIFNKKNKRTTGSTHRLVVTGGFTSDEHVYVRDLADTATKKFDGTMMRWPEQWKQLRPTVMQDTNGECAVSCYGASLTALDDCHAVRFGGFQSGGYSNETSQVALLTVRPTTTERWEDIHSLEAKWEVIQTRRSKTTLSTDESLWKAGMARAYHTATLLMDRYLLVLGGMQSSKSIFAPALLDCQTWTWLDQQSITAGMDVEDSSLQLPASRHGHSVVPDLHRNRLLLFGGGNGTDLLYSGRDNTEVWELLLGENWRTDLIGSLPWRWRLLHPDQNNNQDSDDDVSSSSMEEETMDGQNVEAHTAATANGEDIEITSNQLATCERLNLGRCHAGFQVARDTGLLIFGSRRPSTNRILGYRFDKDCFFRPATLGNFVPCPRLSFASAYLEEAGYLFVHGGFTTQSSQSISEPCILDLAPLLQRDCEESTGLVVNIVARSHDRVTDAGIAEVGYNLRNSRQHEFLRYMMMLAANADQDESDY